jgi:enoyl-CoA hydratase/carnithine racemase
MAHRDILYAVRDRIATITLNRPERLNAWTDSLEGELRLAMKAAADDGEVRVIVLTGAGRGFCAGGDITGFGDVVPAFLEKRVPRFRGD